MNLPHLEPILFAKEIIKKTKEYALVKCEFPCIPTLGMSLEASAQASGALAEKQIDGYLAGATDVQLLKNFDKKIFITKVTKIYQMDNMELFSFEFEEYVKGKFAIYAK